MEETQNEETMGGAQETNARLHQENDDDTGERPPPLPPRPSLLNTSDNQTLQSKATTALSSLDIQTLSFPDGTRGTFSTPAGQPVSDAVSEISSGLGTPNRKSNHTGSDFDDSASLTSLAPTLKAHGDLASLLDDGLNAQSPAWRLLNSQSDEVNPFETIEHDEPSLANFENEFEDMPPVDSKAGNEGGSIKSKNDIDSNLDHRGSVSFMEVQVQALSYTLYSWKTNLQ